MSLHLDLRRALVLQVPYCTRGEFLPGSSARRPAKFLLEPWKQSLHPTHNRLLHGQQASHGPLQQPVSEVDITLRQHVARGLICKQSHAETLRSVTLDV